MNAARFSVARQISGRRGARRRNQATSLVSVRRTSARAIGSL